MTIGDKTLEISSHAKVICLIHALSDLDQENQKVLIDQAWEKLESQGILIVHEVMPNAWHEAGNNALHDRLASLGELSTYSSIVASKISDSVEISHYSTIQEEKLRQEKQNQSTVFKVIQKK